MPITKFLIHFKTASKLPVDESMEPVRAISIDCPIEEIGGNAELVIDNLRRKYMKK